MHWIACVTWSTTHTGTVVEAMHMEQAVDHFKRSREYKCDKKGNCNVAIGKVRAAMECYICGRWRGQGEGGKRKGGEWFLSGW